MDEEENAVQFVLKSAKMNGTVNFMSLNTFLHSLSTSTEQNFKKEKKEWKEKRYQLKKKMEQEH